MINMYDYRKFAVLYVDDEQLSLKYFVRAFEGHFRILTATTVAEGYALFETHRDEIALVISDQRMPGEPGVRLLERVRELRPQTVRILTTAYSDISAAIEAVNSGAIYKYITKPWDLPQLEMIIKRGLEFFLVQRERDQLMREKLSTIHNIMITDRIVTLGVVAAGLAARWHNAPAATRQFIDLAPDRLNADELAIERLQDPTFWRSFYEQVKARMTRVVALLDARLPAHGTVENPQSDLAACTAAAIAALNAALRDKQIAVSSQIAGTLPRLPLAPEQLQQLLALVISAQSVMVPSASKISIAAASGAEVNSPAVQIQLSDDAPACSDASLRALFDPFAASDEPSFEAGVGLLAAYFIVYHHGGSIAAQTRAGQLRFTIRLPIQPPAAPAQAADLAFVNDVVMNDALWDRLLGME